MRKVTPPGATIQDLLDERGMTQVQLARSIKRPVKTINELVKGKCALTAQTAIELEAFFKIDAEFWMTREANYRLNLARHLKKRSKSK